MTAPLRGTCKKIELAFAPQAPWLGTETNNACAGAVNKAGSWGRLPLKLAAARADVPDVIQIDGAGAGGVLINLEPRSHSDGSVQAISIAPDSPLDAVWLYFGAGDRHLIAPGSPFVGDLGGHETALIVPQRSLPDLAGLIVTGGSVDDTRTQYYADFQTNPAVIGRSGGAVTSASFIARLNLYRGNARPFGLGRAPLAAQVAWSTDPANGVSVLGDEPVIYACTAGRRCVDFLAMIGTQVAGTCTVYVDGVDADISGAVNSFISPGVNAQVTPLVVATAISTVAPFAWRYEGTPFTAMRMRIAMVSGTAKAIGVSQINAWDQRSQ